MAQFPFPLLTPCSLSPASGMSDLLHPSIHVKVRRWTTAVTQNSLPCHDMMCKQKHILFLEAFGGQSMLQQQMCEQCQAAMQETGRTRKRTTAMKDMDQLYILPFLSLLFMSLYHYHPTVSHESCGSRSTSSKCFIACRSVPFLTGMVKGFGHK